MEERRINIIINQLALFSVIVGLLQIFADTYLCRKTLVYHNGYRNHFFIKDTPLEVSVIWVVTVFIFGMIYMFLADQYANDTVQNIFIAIGVLVFIVVEIIVGNYLPDKLWKRIYCHQTNNVAHYALVAESLTVAILIAPFEILRHSIPLSSLIFLSVVTGIIIVLIFRFCCILWYQKN